jgi:bacillithiol system protein YtxJ
MPIRPLPQQSDAQLREALDAQALVVVYKHSPTCGLCDIAIAEVEAFVAASPDTPVWMVDVLSQRPLSQGLEAMTGIQHESPQILVFRHGQPVWNGSHRRVTRARIEEALASAN